MILRPSIFEDEQTSRLQQAAQEASNKASAKSYVRSKSIFATLISGTVNIAHGLKRKPAGWFFHTVLGTPSVYVATAPDTQNIALTSSAPGSCVVEVW